MKTLSCLITIAVTTASSALFAKGEPLTETYIDRMIMPNPYAHIPAQCYIETSAGTQNACQYCHTDGLSKRHFGNNTPQAGSSIVLGNLQTEYAFTALHYPHVVNGSVTPWINTIFPEKLRAEVKKFGHDPDAWDMTNYIRQDNWSPAFSKRPGSPKDWDAGVKDPFRLFPGLDPADLPADADGFVRSKKPENSFFKDRQGYNTGWRSINFVPYGIFTPLTGSVSGIYLRLPEKFMRNESGEFDGDIYTANLNLLAQVIQDRLGEDDPDHYLGQAKDVEVVPGTYPLGTEFAHPLHYVDMAADHSDGAPSPYPGARAKRVKEIRYMYKFHPFNPYYGGANVKEEEGPARVGDGEGWIDNGAGWILAGYIEDAKGDLRPQTPSELVQCVGCHSGNGPQDDIAYEEFTSGTGNTIDSTWAFPRQIAGESGWSEMDVMGYTASNSGPIAQKPDPINRHLGKGEFRHFLETVVGASLYGDMPKSVEAFMAKQIRKDRGYSSDWPSLDTTSAESFLRAQRIRQKLMKELTKRGEHLDDNGNIAGALLYPPKAQALESARGYRQVVVTQRYDFGKDVFSATPATFRYFRTRNTAFTHQDGRPYKLGEVITDREIDTDPKSVTYGVGITKTLIGEGSGKDFISDYQPLLDYSE
jgi:hypothetical protein